jgi:hypothetical protein
LTTAEHYAIKKALWDDLKHLPLTRGERTSLRNALYFDYLERIEERNRAEEAQAPREGSDASASRDE